MPINPTDILAVASGVSAHIFVFRVGEWDVASPRLFVFYLTAFSVGVLVSKVQLDVALSAVAKLAGYHVFGVYFSMLVYRAFLHRLNQFPGPFLARLSNFYITARAMKKLHLFEEIQKLHNEYGDYVRIGPSEISISDPKAVTALYSGPSPVTKGPWYTLLEPRTPLFMACDKDEHTRRRRVWDHGFSTQALLGYDPRITKSIDLLVQAIDKRLGQPMDMYEWFAFFVFDVIEDLAFNKTSNMLMDGKEAYVLNTIREDMWNIAFFTHLPWLVPFFKRTPLLNHNYLKFWKWIQDHIDERIKNEPDQPDIFSWLLAAYNKSAKTQRDNYDLHGDTQLIVVAGSDSVAATLTHLFLELAHHPEIRKSLQNEIDALPNLAHENLMTIELLDAVIHETMRLHPPVPSGTQRMTPREGLQIGDKHIPGDTIVQVPSYTVFRDSRSFERPLDFVPDRWTTQPELIRDRSVFIPFNSGPYACVGKRLAMMEIRRCVCEVLSRYDYSAVPGHDREAWLDGKLDTFTIVSAPLPLVFEERVR
ncbi:cytochrome P450 monooxygenase-like protein [Xylariaceae sp. FL0255]|nr:cytochrome P450 monooxygenase-like protein [Xylariaceae sp. FL0255]